MSEGLKRVQVDTAPLGAGDDIVGARGVRVWPWYAGGVVALTAAAFVAAVDLGPRATTPPAAGTALAALAPPEARPSFTALAAARAPDAPGVVAPDVAPGALEPAAPAASAARAEGDPLTARSLNSLGLAARKKGDHAAARTLYREALALDPRHVWSRFNLACELALAGDPAGALALLEEVARIGGPDATRALTVHAPKDRDLRSLARDPRFRALTRPPR